VLYQLSYVGVCRDFPDSLAPFEKTMLRGCCKISVGRCSGEG
jgi:hypothetical protein